MLTLSFSTIKSMLLTQYQKAMLSIVNESEVKVFQQELLTVKIYPTLQQMGSEAAKEVGALIAKRAQDKKIKTVVFDRSGYLYHGIIKDLAEAAREAGLEF